MPKYDKRESAAKRGYGYKWQQARIGYLRSHPLCVNHQRRGILEASSVVDHIKPHKGNQELFWDRENWQALCKPCHDSWKSKLERSGKDTGCDISGAPIDTNHHWNK